MARTFIRGSDLGDGVITSAKLANASVGTSALIDASISTAKLQDASITAAKLGSASVGSSALQTGSVTSAALGAGSVLAAAIGAGEVGTAALASGAVTSAKIATGAVDASAVAAAAIGTSALQDGAVTSAKLGAASVQAAAIGAGQVGSDALASGAVTSAKLSSASVGTAAIIDANVTTDKLAANAVTPGKADLTAEWSFAAGKLKTTMAATPADSDVVTKSYVDSIAQGANWKESVRAVQFDASFDPTTVIAGSSFGGVTVADKDRILWIKSTGSDPAAGVYVVGVSGSTRAPDFDAPNEIKGAAVFCREGNQADAGFICTTDGAITVGTTPLAFTQFTGLGQVTAGDGLTKSGNTLSVNTSNGIQITSDVLGIKLDTNPGMTVSTSGLKVGAGNGINVGATAISVKAKTNGGITVDANGVAVSAANGVQVDGGGFVSVKLNASNPALVADGAGLSVLVDGADAIEATGTGLKLKGASITTAKLGDAAVSTAKIADGAITLAKLGSDVTAAIGKADNGMTFIASANQTTFNLAHGDVDSSFGSLMVYLNGRLQYPGAGNDFSFSNGTGPAGVDQVVFEFQLAADDFVAITYGRA
jgi:hypothetical protein